jgi:IclR family acetate operon transcriptional repressor
VLSHALERFTDRTLVDPGDLARDADTTRARGYASEDGEYRDGVRGVAAPVFVGEEAVAALGVSGPDLDLDALAPRVVELAEELTASVGCNRG